MKFGVFPVMLWLACCLPAAAEQTCRLAIVFAVDVSGSVDPREYALQKSGLANALRNPEVRAAILNPPGAGVAASVVEWSGEPHQAQTVDWAYLNDAAAIFAFADAVEAAERPYDIYSTAIGEALAFSAQLLEREPFSCRRAVIDVSGDGPSNEGRPPGPIRDALAASGVTVNGLPILESEQELTEHYRAEVIGGPGAFAIEAARFKDYPEAIERKLLREFNPLLAAAPEPGVRLN